MTLLLHQGFDSIEPPRLALTKTRPLDEFFDIFELLVHLADDLEHFAPFLDGLPRVEACLERILIALGCT